MLFGDEEANWCFALVLVVVFLKSVYVVFDQGNTRIGMAQRS